MIDDLNSGSGLDLRKKEDGGAVMQGETSPSEPLILTDLVERDTPQPQDLNIGEPETGADIESDPEPVKTIGQKLKGLFRRGKRPLTEDSKDECMDAVDPVEGLDTPIGAEVGVTSEGPVEQVTPDEGEDLSSKEPDTPASHTPEVQDATEPSPRRFGLFGRRKGGGSGGEAPADPAPELTPDVVIPAEAGMSALTPVPSLTKPSRSDSSKMKKGRDPRGYPPIQVLIGWIGESSRKDVLEHARGFATDHIEALDTAWITMAEFRGGTLFEIHEGGGGAAYLPDVIEELSRDPDQVIWVPSGTKLNRVVTISIVEDRPFSMMLNEADSARVRASGQRPIERRGRMRRLQPRGTGILVAGGTLFAVAFGALATSAFLSSRIDQQPIPSLPYSAETLPHGQIISLSDALREDRWVSRILFENGSWRAEFETFDDLILPDDTEEAQTLINEAVERDGILQAERERKVRELGAE
jgi:hypothetical protein